jgi:endonuclease-3
MDTATPYEYDPTLGRVRTRLRGALGPVANTRRLTPIWQLIQSIISGRTPDRVSRAAFERLTVCWPQPETMMAARPQDIEAVIFDVEHAEPKSRWLIATLRTLHNQHGDLSLDFLGQLSTEAAFRKLCNLTGVGPKAAATTLNFSSLKRRIMVVDSHVARVAGRLGLACHKDLGRAQAELSECLSPAWDGDDLYELHWLFRRHGQDVCTETAPGCRACPLADLCPSARSVQ